MVEFLTLQVADDRQQNVRLRRYDRYEGMSISLVILGYFLYVFWVKCKLGGKISIKYKHKM